MQRFNVSFTAPQTELLVALLRTHPYEQVEGLISVIVQQVQGSQRQAEEARIAEIRKAAVDEAAKAAEAEKPIEVAPVEGPKDVG